MTDEQTLYRFDYDGPAPLIFMGEGFVSIERGEDHDEEHPTPYGELRSGDTLVLSVLPGVDFLHHVTPGDQVTAEAMALLESVEPTVQEEAPPALEPEDDYPYEGTKDDVMAWVGDDLSRVPTAMHNEVATGSPRSTLTDALQRLVASQEG